MIHARESEALKRRLNEIYVKHTGQAYEPSSRALERDNFMTAEAAKEFGLDRPGAREASRADRHPGLTLKPGDKIPPGASFCRVTPFLLIARPPRVCMGIRERQRFGRSILGDGTFY